MVAGILKRFREQVLITLIKLVQIFLENESNYR
jgi:hypothetical protein